MSDRPLDAERIFTALDRHDVRYVLVGGLAAQAHGDTRLTKDVDLCLEWTDANQGDMAAALRELGGRLIFEGTSMELTPDAQLMRGMELGNWETTAGQIDVLLGIPQRSRTKLARYDTLERGAVILDISGHQVTVAALRDIIRSEEIADRPKDQEALSELRALDGRDTEAP